MAMLWNPGKMGRRTGVKWREEAGSDRYRCGGLPGFDAVGEFPGVMALKKKSFFEVVRDEVGRTKVTVTGNVDGIDDVGN